MAEAAGRAQLALSTGGISEVVRPFTKNVFKTPAPPTSPAPITTQTKAVQDAVADAAQRRSKARGFSSTILQSFLQGSSQAEGLKPTIGS